MYLTDQSQQRQLFAFTPRDLLPDTSDVWLFIDLFDHLDLDAFDSAYSNEGQHPIDPKLMLRSIFYGLTHGVVSGHKLAAACRYDNRFIVLSGQQLPHRRTFDRFINRHEACIESLFVEVVRLAKTMGLVKLGRVAIDGSRFKANTNTGGMAYEKMDRAIMHIKDELAKLKADLAANNAQDDTHDEKLEKQIVERERRIEKIKRAKAQLEAEAVKAGVATVAATAKKSFNDPQALSLSSRNKTFMYGYNMQAVVDDERQIIVAADVHDSATDYQALPMMLDQVESNCDGKIAEVLADMGYKSADNVLTISEHGAEPYVATTTKGRPDCEVEFFEQVTPGTNPNDYHCMAGKRLPINKTTDSGIEFVLRPGFCADCPFATTCKGFGRKYLRVHSERARQAMKSLAERSRTSEFKEVYKQRKAIVEPVFGNIRNKGMRILRVGRRKVRTWWLMACIAHNLEKVAAAWLITNAGLVMSPFSPSH